MPSSVREPYPERRFRKEGWFDRVGAAAVGPVVTWWRRSRIRFGDFVNQVAAHGGRLGSLDEAGLMEAVQGLRQRLRREGFESEALAAEAFALVREAASMTIGMRHHEVQLIGGLVLLRGMVAEMETGEGKTLTATLPACTAALAGQPVHIITVNDYLVSRDAESMRPVYQALGLSVGTVMQGMDPDQRRQAYACDITYCTNKEIAFDYLKDRLLIGRKSSQIGLRMERVYGRESRLGRLLLRGLGFAIVDEADSAMIDEARTPLIISGAGNLDEERQFYEQALTLADGLDRDADFQVLARERRVRLTNQGKLGVAQAAETLGGLWKGAQRREELVTQALAARHVYLLDRDYLVSDGKVQIVDEYSGRVMPDRSWEQGLHQMIETKEGCELTGRRETLARISYQRFFRRYLHLAGMTGTAREVAGELWSVYRLCVVRVPTNRPLKRSRKPTRIYPFAEDKWRAVVEHVAALHEADRPVLVGTRSVEASERISELLAERGLDHAVLNARQDAEEADIVALAGASGCITVATNMAGRGTDIVLRPGVAEGGGLHVVLTELHEAKRIDRQLMGRCGRQGDPGSYQAFLSLEDELATTHLGALRRGLGTLAAWPSLAASQWLLRYLLYSGQRSAERLHSRMRHDLLKMDEKLDTSLAFTGGRD